MIPGFHNQIASWFVFPNCWESQFLQLSLMPKSLFHSCRAAEKYPSFIASEAKSLRFCTFSFRTHAIFCYAFVILSSALMSFSTPYLLIIEERSLTIIASSTSEFICGFGADMICFGSSLSMLSSSQNLF